MAYSLETDLNTLCHKLKDSDYAQSMYAALCNNEFVKDSKIWHCSWRYAGEMVARLRNLGEDYMDYYCSGILDDRAVVEGEITDEVRKDIESLGWTIK